MSLEAELIDEKIKDTLYNSFKKMTFKRSYDPMWDIY